MSYTPVMEQINKALKRSSGMCNCSCHIPGTSVLHCAPCCDYTGYKDESRHPQQETIDFVGSLINRSSTFN